MKRYNLGQIVLLVVALLVMSNIGGFLLTNPDYIPPIMRWTEPVTVEPFSTEPSHPHATAILCTDMQPQYGASGKRWEHRGAEFITNTGYCSAA